MVYSQIEVKKQDINFLCHFSAKGNNKRSICYGLEPNEYIFRIVLHLYLFRKTLCSSEWALNRYPLRSKYCKCDCFSGSRYIYCVCVLQKEVNSEAYGPSMSELEKQIAAHNILHKEIEAYNTQLSPDSTSSKVSHDPTASYIRPHSSYHSLKEQFVMFRESDICEVNFHILSK